MFEVVDDLAGTSSLHATRAEALAAGRSLAYRLADLRGLGAIVEEACSCDWLICGTVLDEVGEAIDLEPLVWIEPGPVPLRLQDWALSLSEPLMGALDVAGRATGGEAGRIVRPDHLPPAGRRHQDRRPSKSEGHGADAGLAGAATSVSGRRPG